MVCSSITKNTHLFRAKGAGVALCKVLKEVPGYGTRRKRTLQTNLDRSAQRSALRDHLTGHVTVEELDGDLVLRRCIGVPRHVCDSRRSYINVRSVAKRQV